jgi:hypothetical protein
MVARVLEETKRMGSFRAPTNSDEEDDSDTSEAEEEDEDDDEDEEGESDQRASSCIRE